MSKQFQHIIPQVYLKQFGFQKFGNKWFVSVKNNAKNIWEDREARSFLGENDIYTLNITKSISKKIIENDLNGGIEGRLLAIVGQLKRQESLTENIQMAVAETVANFLCRNQSVRNWIKRWLKRDDLRAFFDHIIKYSIHNKEHQDEVYSKINLMPIQDRINYYMVVYTNYVSIVMRAMSMEVIIGGKKHFFFTSDNPVCLMGVDGYGLLEKEETEIYFPLSPKYIIRFFWYNRDLGITRNYVNATDEQYEYFHKEVLFPYVGKFLISPIDKSILGK